MKLTVEQAVNRGANLLGVTLLVVEAATLISVIFIEDEWIDRIDDLVILALAVVGIAWYRYGSNRFHRSLVPLALLLAGLVTHVASISLELDDPKAIGDDILSVQYFLFAVIFVAWQIIRGGSKRTAMENAGTDVP